MVPQKLSDKHKLIAFLAAMGLRNRQIGEAVGMGPNAVSQVRQNEEFKALVEEIRETRIGGTVSSVIEKLSEYAIPSIENLKNLSASRDEAIARGSSKDILQFFTDWVKPAIYRDAGSGSGGTALHLDADALKGLMAIAAEAEESVIDAEIVPEEAPTLPPRAPRKAEVISVEDFIRTTPNETGYMESALV